MRGAGKVTTSDVCRVLAGGLAFCAAVILLVSRSPTGRSATAPQHLRLPFASGGGAIMPAVFQMPPMHEGSCRIPAGRRLAIYNPRPYHSEVFGVIMAYARACNHTLTIFFDRKDRLSTLEYYDVLYGPFSVPGQGAFQEQEEKGLLDAVFFTTPEIPAFGGESGQKANAHRYIYFNHLDRGGYKRDWQLLKMGMSPLVVFPFALPVYPPPALIRDGGDPPAKPGSPGLPESNVRSLSAKNLVMVGTLWDGDNYLLADLFEICKGIAEAGWTVTVYSREWKVADGTKYPGNMKLLASRPTEEVIEAVQAATVMLIFPSPSSWYLTDRMTGGLPLSISQGAPILTTEAFAAIYALDRSTGTLVAPRGSTADAVEALLALTPVTYSELLAGAMAVRSRFWAHAVHTLEELLLAVPDISAATAAAAAAKNGGVLSTRKRKGPNPTVVDLPMVMAPGGGGPSRWTGY